MSNMKRARLAVSQDNKDQMIKDIRTVVKWIMGAIFTYADTTRECEIDLGPWSYHNSKKYGPVLAIGPAVMWTRREGYHHPSDTLVEYVFSHLQILETESLRIFPMIRKSYEDRTRFADLEL